MDILQGDDVEMRAGNEESHPSTAGKRSTINMTIFDESVAEHNQGTKKDVPDGGRLPEPHQGGYRLSYPPLDISAIAPTAIAKLRNALSSWLYGGISKSYRT